MFRLKFVPAFCFFVSVLVCWIVVCFVLFALVEYVVCFGFSLLDSGLFFLSVFLLWSVACSFSFALMQKNKEPKRKNQGFIFSPTPSLHSAKAQKLASLKQSALLHAAFRSLASRRKNEAGPALRRVCYAVRFPFGMVLRHFVRKINVFTFLICFSVLFSLFFFLIPFSHSFSLFPLVIPFSYSFFLISYFLFFNFFFLLLLILFLLLLLFSLFPVTYILA